jgi:hypothetical protein
MKRIISACIAIAISSVFTTHAFADAEGTCDYNQALANKESSGGNYGLVNQYGYAGKYQMGTSALIDIGYKNKAGNWTGKNGINSQADFLANKGVQEQAQTELMAKQDQYTKGLQSYVGQPIPGCGKPLTQDGLRAAAHLVGAGGAESFLKSGGVCGKKGNGLTYNTTDGNGTCAGTYMCSMSGCTPTKKDMSKKTCDVVMPMIEAISCSNFPAEMQAFCQQAKPALMTRGECSSAEAWAEKAPKGPNKEACEGSSFGPGTGSWSFVLACSWAQQVVADQDGVKNKDGSGGGSSGSGSSGTAAGGTGPVSDPQCMEKLKGMGIQFDQIGQYTNGSYNGKTCVIQNAVAYRGGAVPFGAKLTMTCDMAIAMEKWGQQMKAIGATSYYSIGSTRPCGPMRDNTGNLPGTITEHALGQAVDVSGFNMGGMKVSMGSLLQPATADGALAAQAKAAACATFRRVLSPTYVKYLGSYVHFHVEWASQGKCR